MASCKKNESVIYKNESIEVSFEKAHEKKQKMCLVLVDERDTISRAYMKRLEAAYQTVIRDAVFNVIDLTNSENRWYGEWINSSSYPVTCIFSEKEKLIAIVGGASTYSFNSIKTALKNDLSGNNFGYKSTLSNLDFNILSVFLDNVLKCKLSTDRGENCDMAIDKTLDILQYPFNVYLKYINEINQNRIRDATGTAHRLLKFQDDTQYTRVYSDMFKDVRRYTDPHYSPDNDPELTFGSENIVLRNCTPGDAVPFRITVRNTGHSILQMKEINVGCSCIASLNDSIVNINPGEEDVLNFTFTPDSKGEIRRTVTFISNATNPFEQIEIVAFVN
jgi:hypothetical protein